MSKYDQAFRDEAVRLALSSSQPIAQTAKDLGVEPHNLYWWVRQEKEKSPNVVDDQGNEINLVDELARLRKENSRLKEEREILKKAAKFFAKETN